MAQKARSLVRSQQARWATGLLLPTDVLLEADSRSQIFFGLMRSGSFRTHRIEPKPDSAWLVGPARIDQAKLDKLGKWMARGPALWPSATAKG